MLVIPKPHEALLTQTRHRHTNCYRVERLDGQVYRFTDHDATLQVSLFDPSGVLVSQERFSPMNGIGSTARRKQADLKPQNQDVIGVLDDSAISLDDIRSGLFREARITVHLVDWQFPFLGPFESFDLWVDSVKFNGEFYTATVSGLGRWLAPKIGHVHGRTCRWELGSAFGDSSRAGCKFDLSAATFTYTDVRVNAVTDRGAFDAIDIDIDGGLGDDWFALGLLVFQTGLNAGIPLIVKSYTDAGRAFQLMFRAPLDISTGDQFTVRAGCDKLRATCISKFSNIANFKGYPFMLGRDRAIRGPTRV